MEAQYCVFKNYVVFYCRIHTFVIMFVVSSTSSSGGGGGCGWRTRGEIWISVCGESQVSSVKNEKLTQHSDIVMK
jgi:hypothetical protein